MRSRLTVLSAALGGVGIALWAGVAVLLLHPGPGADTSLPHFRICELGVVLGGAFVVGAIALLLVAD